VVSVVCGRSLSRWVISEIKAGPRASSDGSYVGSRTALLECVARASSSALDR
jgi:hypothetical protein